jgi:hypothetical protein
MPHRKMRSVAVWLGGNFLFNFLEDKLDDPS